MLIKVFGYWVNPENILYLRDQRIAFRTDIVFNDGKVLDVPNDSKKVAEEINRQMKGDKQ